MNEGFDQTTQDSSHGSSNSVESFPIVGIGASAGGLEALEQFFDHTPETSGMCFVVVQHLSPDFKSLMDELLRRRTRIPVVRVEDGVKLRPNVIYLMPPRTEMVLSGGCLYLTEKDPNHGFALPIDNFLRSLAHDAGNRSVGVILSGTGSDGSRGIRDIHDVGGLVVAQSEESSRFDGMPRSARETEAAYRSIDKARESVMLNQQMQKFEEIKLQKGDSDLLTVNLREAFTFDARLVEIEAQQRYFESQADFRAAMAADITESPMPLAP